MVLTASPPRRVLGRLLLLLLLHVPLGVVADDEGYEEYEVNPDGAGGDDEGSLPKVMCGKTRCNEWEHGGCCDDGYDLKCVKDEDACLAQLGMWFPGGRVAPDEATMRCGDKSCAHEPGSTGCCDRGRGYKCAQSKKRCVGRNGLWHEGPLPLRNITCGLDQCDPGRSYVGCCDRGGGWICEQSKADCVAKHGIFGEGDQLYPKQLEFDEVVNETFYVPVVTCGGLLCDFLHMGCCKNTEEHGFFCTTSKKICIDSHGTWYDGLGAGVPDRGSFGEDTQALLNTWNIAHQMHYYDVYNDYDLVVWEESDLDRLYLNMDQKVGGGCDCERGREGGREGGREDGGS